MVVNKEKLMAAGIIVFTMVVMVIVIPVIATMLWTGRVKTLDDTLHKSGYKVMIDDDNSLDMEEFIIYSTIAQLGDKACDETYDEAIKTMLVVNRTKVLKNMDGEKQIFAKDTKLPYVLKEQCIENYGDNYRKIYEKMLRLENATSKNIITFNGETINPVYHAVSAGMTRNGNKEYLKAVDSSDDVTMDNFVYITYYTPDEFKNLIEKINPEITINSENPLEGMEIVKEDEVGYVTELKFGEKSISGNDFYKKSGIKSSCFIIEKFNEAIRIITKGEGHGKGLSINGCVKMAEHKKDYKEIITHYYTGVTLIPYA